jgi:hypothetical protein
LVGFPKNLYCSPRIREGKGKRGGEGRVEKGGAMDHPVSQRPPGMEKVYLKKDFPTKDREVYHVDEKIALRLSPSFQE